jgi:D-3-phosphoglycerate dehydrogenase
MSQRIRTLNKISPLGLKLLGAPFTVGPEVPDPEGLLVRSAVVDTDAFPSLLAVARAGAGVNNITVDKATARGVCVFNTPGANANAVAELVFIMLGMAARNIPQSLEFTRALNAEADDKAVAAKVEAGKASYTGFELAGKTLGVVGLGRIGVLVANYGVQHGMTVVGYDPAPSLANFHQLDPRAEVAHRLDDVVRAADVITVHVPLLDQTRNLLGARQLAAMKPGVMLLNYARKGIYDEGAVLDALAEGRVRCYLTDFPHKALLGNPKVVATPHLGASTAESEDNCAVMAARQLRAYLELGVVTNAVNFPTLESYPQESIRTRIVAVHRDIPAMIAKVTQALGSAGYNLQALSNGSNGAVGYTVMDLEVDVSDPVVDTLRAVPDVLRVRALRFDRV